MAAEDSVRVSTLELFFDLVFVFVVTQLTSVLADEMNGHGLVQVVLMLALIWWMYAGYAWLTNTVAPDRATRRMVLLGGMAAYLIVALAVPRAFDAGGPAFGLAYLAVVGVHVGLFARGMAFGAVFRLARYNLASALLVLAGGIAGGTAQYVLWAAAALLEWITPKLIGGAEDFVISPAHFVERHGLVVLIAIGESIVAVGAGASALALDFELAAIAVLGLALSACLWWAYFGGDDERAERALAAAPPVRRSNLAVNAFGYGHLLLLLGIVAIAAAEETVIAHPFDALAFAEALALGGGVAVFLVGDEVFRRSLGIGRGPWRAGAAALALATVPLALLAAALQLLALVGVLVVALGVEARAAARAPVPA